MGLNGKSSSALTQYNMNYQISKMNVEQVVGYKSNIGTMSKDID